MNNYKSGKWAEFLARMYLRIHGYQIVATNVITGRGTTAGEIDIVAKRGKCVVFVEVKKRKTLDDASYAIMARQQQRLVRGAQNYMRCHYEFKGYDCRFDAILVCLPFSIRHIKNAWSAN